MSKQLSKDGFVLFWEYYQDSDEKVKIGEISCYPGLSYEKYCCAQPILPPMPDSLTATFFETGTYADPTKSRNPTILGLGDPTSTQ